MNRRMIAWGVLHLVLLACRPVFAIGWGELVVLIIIVAVLLGPILFRVFRFWEAYRKRIDKDRGREG